MNNKIGYRKFSIWTIIISALVIPFIMGIIISYYALLYSETRQRIIKSGELNAVASAEQIDQYLAKGIEAIKLASYTLDDMIRTSKSQAEIHDFLVSQSAAVQNTTAESSTGIYGYINNEYMDGTNWVPAANYIPTERPWYIDARANVGRVAVVDPYVDAQTNTFMITFSKTLCDAKSVVAMDFSIDPIQKITEDILSQGESDLEIVLDRNYNVIAHSNSEELGKNYLIDQDDEKTIGNELVSRLRSTDESYFSFEFNGEDYIVYSVSVSNDWYCLSVFDTTEEFSRIRYTYFFTIVSLSLIIAILVVIMIHFNKKTGQFAQLSVHVVEALAAAVDAKDKYTNGHSGRVADYAIEISKRYGYSRKKIEEIYMMALLHDIGKIGIPDAVINKPGDLTENEYKIMKTHPEVGAKILEKTSEIPRLAIGAHWHHERYDGTGYPDGLTGEDIPEEARIIAVADAYDAMTSARSYRDALPIEVVIKEIENNKGTQFDPHIANIMLQMIEENKK